MLLFPELESPNTTTWGCLVPPPAIPDSTLTGLLTESPELTEFGFLTLSWLPLSILDWGVTEGLWRLHHYWGRDPRPYRVLLEVMLCVTLDILLEMSLSLLYSNMGIMLTEFTVEMVMIDKGSINSNSPFEKQYTKRLDVKAYLKNTFRYKSKHRGRNRLLSIFEMKYNIPKTVFTHWQTII